MKKTAKYYSENPDAKRVKYAYDKKYNKTKKATNKRVELNKYNREKGTYGNGDNSDARHVNGKIIGFTSASKNRASKTDSAGDRRARGGKKK